MKSGRQTLELVASRGEFNQKAMKYELASQSSEMVAIMIIVLLPEVMIQQGDHEISENLKH